MVDRHDDELAGRRATGRPKRERGAGGGALPLQWADPPPDPVVGDADQFPVGAEEADSDVAPDEGAVPGDVVEIGATIDLTGRAERAPSA